ncbi:hypothetical protein LTR44_005470 [Exophiala sp. CCFEE 6388]|nr:hypothetical protein LTR44_005470 [Eurotiomycetes sp. CCFEE 6388]
MLLALWILWFNKRVLLTSRLPAIVWDLLCIIIEPNGVFNHFIVANVLIAIFFFLILVNNDNNEPFVFFVVFVITEVFVANFLFLFLVSDEYIEPINNYLNLPILNDFIDNLCFIWNIIDKVLFISSKSFAVFFNYNLIVNYLVHFFLFKD